MAWGDDPVGQTKATALGFKILFGGSLSGETIGETKEHREEPDSLITDHAVLYTKEHGDMHEDDVSEILCG